MNGGLAQDTDQHYTGAFPETRPPPVSGEARWRNVLEKDAGALLDPHLLSWQFPQGGWVSLLRMRGKTE